MITKKCSKCGKEYPATTEYFGKDKRRKYGLHSHCKECQRKASQKRFIKRKEEGTIQQHYKDNRLYGIATGLRKRGYPNITKKTITKDS